MNFSIQPVLENEKIVLFPLQEWDFEVLYSVASDPKIWEQHPNKDRWRKDVFQTFFEGAMQSKGAFAIVDKASGHVIGSTRMYDYYEQKNTIFIGYTFYATSCWGKGINHSVKALMRRAPAGGKAKANCHSLHGEDWLFGAAFPGV